MKRFLLFVLIFITSLGGLQAQQSKETSSFNIHSPYDTLWKQFDQYSYNYHFLESGLSCLGTIRKKANLEHNEYQLFKADVKYLDLSTFYNPPLETILPTLDSVKRTVGQPYRGLYNFLIGLYLENQEAINRGPSIGQTNLKKVNLWTALELKTNAQRYLDTAIEELYAYAEWPVEDFLFMATVKHGCLYRPAILFDLIAQTYIAYHPHTQSASEEARLADVIHKAIQLHRNRHEPALVIEYELQNANQWTRNIEPSADSASFWRELDRLALQYGPMPAIDYERGVYLYEMLQNDTTLSVAAQNDYYEQCVRYFNQVVQNAKDSFYINNARSFLGTITAPKLSLRPMRDYIIPSAKILLPISYQNIDTLFVSAYKIQESIIVYSSFFKPRSKGDTWGIRAEDCETPVLQNAFILPKPVCHNRYTTDLFLDSLAAGHYLLIFHTGKVWDSTNVRMIGDITVTNIAAHQSSGKGHNYFTLMDARTGNPLTHHRVVKVYDNYRNNPVKLPVYTNRNGQIRTRMLPPQSIADLSLLVKDGKDFQLEIFTEPTSSDDYSNQRQRRKNDPYGNYTKPNKKYYVHNTQSTIILDRNIYRPGQTVYFKAYAVEERKLLKNHPVELVLLDNNDREVEVLLLKTNEFGTVSGQFQLSSRMYDDGSVVLRFPKSEKAAELSVAFFEIAEYKLPTFKVTLDKSREPIVRGDTVRIQGRALSYTGVPVANAQARISISNTSYRYDSSKEEIFLTRTDSDGRFVLPYKTNEEQYYYCIRADVTDLNGETHTAESYEFIGGKPFSLLLKEDYAYKETAAYPDSLSFIVRCYRSYYEARNLLVPIRVEVCKLQNLGPVKPCLYPDGQRPTQPLYDERTYQRYFPEYSTDKTSTILKNRADGEKMFSIERVFSPDSLLRFSVKGWAAGAYRIRLTAELPNGTVDTFCHYTVITPQSEKDTFDVFPIYSRWLQTSCKKGSRIRFAVGSCLRGAPVYGVLSQGSTIIKTFKTDPKVPYQILSVKTRRIPGSLGLYIFSEQNANVYEDEEQAVKYFRLAAPVRTFKNGKLQLGLVHWNSLLEPGKKEYGEIVVTNASTGKPECAETLVWMIDSSILDVGIKANIKWLLPDEGFYREKDIQRAHLFGYRNLAHQSLTNDPTSSVNFPIAFPTKTSKQWVNIDFFRYIMEPPVFDADRTTSSSVRVSGENLKTSPGRSVSTVVDGVRVRDNHEYDELASKSLQELSTSAAGIVRVRKDFRETAFFYPDLRTSADGHVRFDFSVPDQLTTWKLYAAAHTPDLHSGWLTAQLQTRQTLMLQSAAPRFLREGDTMTFQAKVTNLSDTLMRGQATLRLFDLQTGQPLPQLLLSDSTLSFACEKGKATNVGWRITTPDNIETLSYRIVAMAGTYGDGEEGIIPILPKRMMVTESKAFAVPAGDSTTVRFDRLLNDTSHIREDFRYTLEASTLPVWSAILSLPYLIQYPYDCNEQTFAKYFANALALKLFNDNPVLDSLCAQWRAEAHNANTESPLLENASLQDIALDETPWLAEAQNEHTRKHKLAELFEKENLKTQIRQQFQTLKDHQLAEGGWGWYPNSPYSPYITNHIAVGLQKLQQLGISLPKNFRMEKLTARMDSNQVARYRLLTGGGHKTMLFNETDVQYLYARTFAEVDTEWLSQPFVRFFLEKATDNIYRANLTRQAEVALILHRIGREEEAQRLIESLRQRAQQDATNGMFWPNSARGYYSWHEAPIERHALLMEAFHEIDPRPDELRAMTQWLLLQKQGSQWSNTKATTEAVYALLLTQSAQSLTCVSDASIAVGGEHFTIQADTAVGIGQLRHVWEGDEVTTKLAEASVRADSAQPTFGALYWQYFEDMDKVNNSADGLQLERALYHHADQEGQLVPVNEQYPAHVGERVTVRFVITCDRDIEYVHLKDQRAAAFEPVSILSHHEYRNGLWYFVSPRNAATHFFLPSLSKGSHVLEYELLVTQNGQFASGTATIECMYAPEYRAISGKSEQVLSR